MQGGGALFPDQEIMVRIPAGVDTARVCGCAARARPAFMAASGDLYVVLSVDEDPRFEAPGPGFDLCPGNNFRSGALVTRWKLKALTARLA